MTVERSNRYFVVFCGRENKPGWSRRQWTDNVRWHRASLHELTYSLQDKTKWESIIKEESIPTSSKPKDYDDDDDDNDDD